MSKNTFIESEVSELYQRIILNSTENIYDECLSFLRNLEDSQLSTAYIRKLRLDMQRISSFSSVPHIMERHIQFLIMLQFEHDRSIKPNANDEVDVELSEWVAELLERLALCTRSRSHWRDFIKKDLVDRFVASHGKTLTQIYFNIGLDPPACLPQLDLSDDSNASPESPMFCAQQFKSPVKYAKFPTSQIISPRRSKLMMRNSLPRALFTESVVVTSGNSNPCLPDGQVGRCSISRIAGSGAAIGHQSFSKGAQKRNSGSGIPVPKLVLMPQSNAAGKLKARRKMKTPVKRNILNTTKSPLVNSVRRRESAKTRDRVASPSFSTTSRKSVSKKFTSSRHQSETTKQRASTRKYQPPSSNRRSGYHRSVLETPNVKMSYPRWERAQMAAAEKTKNRSLIVAESPLKPSDAVALLGSPLRRLKRASSLLSFEDNFIDVGATKETEGENRLQCRAARWQRRQQEEEASLSQFGAGVSGECSTSSSLCVPTAHLLRRRQSSNLFARLGSPVSINKKPVLNSIASSPSILASYTAPTRANSVVCVRPPLFDDDDGNCQALTTPTRHLIVAKTADSLGASSPASQNPLLPPRTPTMRQSTTQSSSINTPPPSKKARRCREVPSSPPRIFDEEAMFLGQDEFRQQTTPLQRRGSRTVRLDQIDPADFASHVKHMFDATYPNINCNASENPVNSVTSPHRSPLSPITANEPGNCYLKCKIDPISSTISRGGGGLLPDLQNIDANESNLGLISPQKASLVVGTSSSALLKQNKTPQRGLFGTSSSKSPVPRDLSSPRPVSVTESTPTPQQEGALKRKLRLRRSLFQ